MWRSSFILGEERSSSPGCYAWLKKPRSSMRARSSADSSTSLGVRRKTLSAIRCMPPSSAYVRPLAKSISRFDSSLSADWRLRITGTPFLNRSASCCASLKLRGRIRWTREAPGACTGCRLRTEQAVAWLLRSREPAVRRFTRRDVLGEAVEDSAPPGPLVRGLLRGQRRDGGFGVHPYAKWAGAHWRLVSLVELEAPLDERLRRAAETVLDWLTGPGHRRGVRTVAGLVPRCAPR